MFLRAVITSGSNELRYILLFIISIVLVTWQYFGMSTRLNVVPQVSSSLSATIHDDHINGGGSETRLALDDGEISFDCHIIRSDTFAFCGVTIPLVESGSPGIDLGSYDHMVIEFDFESEVLDTLLIYMINDEQTPAGMMVSKSMLRAVSAQAGNNRFTLPTRQFFVPSWWLFQNAQTGADPDPHIDNVTSLQVTTGDNTVARDVKVTLRKIEFHGKWITADDLYLGLLISWLLLFTFHALKVMQTMSERIMESRRQNTELLELNRFLSIQKDQYETMAKHDKLTGALNRAGARDVLEGVLRDYQEEHASCALLAIDIDHFKNINDEFGHDVGDQALKRLARFIDEHTRDKDNFVRWGGEEFMLVCPHTSLRAAMNLAETLRSKIENTDLISQARITCSFGVATLDGMNIKRWFKRADNALYDAKANGRNCVRS